MLSKNQVMSAGLSLLCSFSISLGTTSYPFAAQAQEVAEGTAEGTAEGRDTPETSTETSAETTAIDRLSAEIQSLRAEGTVEALRASIPLLEQLLQRYQEAQDSDIEMTVLGFIGLTYEQIGEADSALAYYEQALSLYQINENLEGEAQLLNTTAQIYAERGERGDKGVASERYQRALEIYRTLGNRSEIGSVLSNIASLQSNLGDREQAIDFYQQALVIALELEDPLSEATILNNLAFSDAQWNDFPQAIEHHTRALAIYASLGDRDGEARALNGLGLANSALGKTEIALDAYRQALAIFETLGERSGQATTLTNLGRIYAQVDELDTALAHYEEALALFEAVSNRSKQASVLNNMGQIYSALNDSDRALSFYDRALQLHMDALNRDGQASVLNNIGSIYKDREDWLKALNYYQQSLEISQALNDRSGEATALLNIGFVKSRQSENGPTLKTQAIQHYEQALALFQSIGDRTGEATAHNSIAVLYESQGKLTTALENINSAIALVEDLRTDITPGDLRTSYFATVQDYYQLKQDILMQLGEPEAAFETSEAARARQLIELLGEANVDIRAGVSSTFLDQEQSLRNQLVQLDQQRIIAYRNSNHPSQVNQHIATIDQQSNMLLQQLDQAVTQMRRQSPAYAETVVPEPLSLADIQQQVLDSDTVLMQYTLSETQSYLWVVSQDHFQVYTLGRQADIHQAAQKFQSAISISGSPASTIKRVGDELTAQIMPALPTWIEGKRLLVVGDGILSEIPFAALPIPDQTNYVPLLSEYEILSQPSMTAISVLRAQVRDRPEVDPSLAVLADPVYGPNDERVNTATSSNAAPQSVVQPTTPPSADLARTLRDLDLRRISRLPNTRQEAEAILALANNNNLKSISALDFEANADWVTAPTLSQYSIIHLATHGFINPTNPQLSGVALSLVDERGQPKDNGILRLHNIFNLDLSADLVVLSACQTGRGDNISGEGIIGLSRGFMYAGAERIAVSLWNVNDAATASLMSDFYRYLLEDQLPPAAALRNAQLDAWQAGQSPYLWAAFTLQGEWQ